MATTSYPRWEGDHAGHFVASLASSLAADGHGVTVVAPHAPGAVPAQETGGLRVRRVRYLPESWERLAYGSGIVPNLKRDPRAWVGVPALRRALSREVRRAVRETRADVLHLHWAPTVLLAGAGKGELSGVPTVLTLHGTDAALGRRGGAFGRLLSAALDRVDAVIAVSGEQATHLRESGAWDGVLEVIPSGVPPSLFERPRKSREEGAPFTFVFVGRLIESKGVLDLLDAFLQLDAARPDAARLVFAGSGPLEAQLRERAVARRPAGKVRFAGHLPHGETLDAIWGADALVLPSYGEGSPLVVTEALALGTPVIATCVGAVPELVGGDGGTLIQPADVDALATAMGAWVADPESARRAGAAARVRVARTHAWPILAQRTAEVYERVARPTPPSQVD